MAVAIPGAVCPWIETRFLNPADGELLTGGLIYFYETGTTTPKDTFTSALMDTPNTNPVELDAAGRADIFLAPGGYDVAIHDADDVELYTIEGVEDIGATFFNQLGVILATGSTGVTSGYTVLDTDQFVGVSSTGGASPCVVNLPVAADRGLPIIIKNNGTVALEIRPNGSDTIDGLSTYAVSAASSPTFPTVILLSDGVSAWYVVAKFS